MKRKKLEMALIGDRKLRITTFKRRKQGLLKKLRELTTLCDVKACAIIYGPTEERGSVEQAIWPENDDDIRLLIDSYKSRNKASYKKIKEYRNKKYSSDDIGFINGCNKDELRDLASTLTTKIEVAKSRIDILKRKKEEGLESTFHQDLHEISSAEPFDNPELDHVDMTNWKMMPSLLEEDESGVTFDGQVFSDTTVVSETVDPLSDMSMELEELLSLLISVNPQPETMMPEMMYNRPSPVLHQSYMMMPEMMCNRPTPVAYQPYTVMPQMLHNMPAMVGQQMTPDLTLNWLATGAQQPYMTMPDMVLEMPASLPPLPYTMMPDMRAPVAGESYSMMPEMLLDLPISTPLFS